MLYELTKGGLKISADTHGAELHSVNLDGLEYLWQCGDAWKRYAPILFPFICSPENNTYRAGGTEYRMNANHGFARDKDFSLFEKNDSSMSFILESDTETLAQYPYKFRFIVSYEILADGVKVNHIVQNIDDKPMYFYIGGHPAFNCPLIEGEKFTDYYVEYESNETIKNNNGDIVVDNGKILNISRELFDYDSLVLESVSRAVSLKSRKNAHSVTVEFPESECITVWSPTADDRAQFVCLEPWTSVPVYFDDSEPDIEKKAHAIRLMPEQEYTYSYTIRVK